MRTVIGLEIGKWAKKDKISMWGKFLLMVFVTGMGVYFKSAIEKGSLIE